MITKHNRPILDEKNSNKKYKLSQFEEITTKPEVIANKTVFKPPHLGLVFFLGVTTGENVSTDNWAN